MTDRNRNGARWAIVVAVATVAVALALLLRFAFTGPPPGSELTGRVAIGGKPIVFGTVTAVAADGRVFTAPIMPDGTYVLRNVPSGPVRIAVSSPNPRPIEERIAAANPDGEAATSPRPATAAGRAPGAAGTSKAAPGISIAAPEASSQVPPASAGGTGSKSPPPQHARWFPIPGRYASPATSGLGGEVRGRENTLDLQLDGAGARSTPGP